MNSPDDAAIILENVSKRYGTYQALQSISLTVNKGELFGLLGANGAGKTTAIKMMVGLQRPTTGRIVLWGHETSSDPIGAKKCIGYVPDNPILYGKLTGRETLAMMADLYAVERKLQRDRIERLLDTFGLAIHGDDLVQSYSRGMMQKLALCGALIHEPMILFLDEPTVGLDPVGAKQLKDVLRLLRSEGKTVLLSTHVLDVAEILCDRVGIVHQGMLAKVDSPSHLRENDGSDNLEEAFLRITGRERDNTTSQLQQVFGDRQRE